MDERTDLDAVSAIVGSQGLHVVDVGSGRGALAHQLALRGLQVTGVEPDPHQLVVAEAREPLAGLRWRSGAAEALPCEDASADVVMFNRSLHHVPPERMDAALREAARVLRGGGRLVVLEPDAAGEHSLLMQPFHDEGAVRQLAQEALDRLKAPSWLEEAEGHYLRVYTYSDLHAFRSSMVASTVIDIDETGLDDPQVAHRFEAGRTAAGHHRFTNPIRVRTFRKVRGA